MSKSKNKNMTSVVEPQNISETSVQKYEQLEPVKNTLKECLALYLVPVTIKELWVENGRQTWSRVGQIMCWNKLYVQHVFSISGQMDKTYGRFVLFHVDDT